MDDTVLNLGTGGDTVRTIDRSGSGPKTQVVQLDFGGGGASESLASLANPLPVVPTFSTRSDTYTGVANGTQVDASAKPCTKFSLQVKGTGAVPTAWNIVLEGSLDGTNYTQILQHSDANPLGANVDGATVWGTAGPFLYFRSRSQATLNLGSATNVVATIVGMA